VTGLQASCDGYVKQLASNLSLKLVCADVGAVDDVTAAVACGRLRQTLQACISDGVASTVLDGDSVSYLVRLLTCATPSVGTDCAVCIGLLYHWAFSHRDISNQAKVATLVSDLLDSSVRLDASGNASCFHSLVSVMRSAGGNAREGLTYALEKFLLTHRNDTVVRQLVVSHNIFPTCLDILRSSPSSECMRCVLSILQNILQCQHLQGQAASCTTTSYVSDLAALGAVQVLQSINCFQTTDTMTASIDDLLQWFYDFLSLDEKIRLLVSRRPVPAPTALQLRPQGLILSSLRGDICALEAHPEWLNIDEYIRTKTLVGTQSEIRFGKCFISQHTLYRWIVEPLCTSRHGLKHHAVICVHISRMGYKNLVWLKGLKNTRNCFN